MKQYCVVLFSNAATKPSQEQNDTVTFSCGALPQGISCQFNPQSLTPSNGPAQSVLTVTAATTTAAKRTHPRTLLPLWASGFFGLIVIEGISRRRRLAVALFAVVLLAMLTLTGCGAGSSGGAAAINNVQTVHVIATSSGGNISQQVNITITIQK